MLIPNMIVPVDGVFERPGQQNDTGPRSSQQPACLQPVPPNKGCKTLLHNAQLQSPQWPKR